MEEWIAFLNSFPGAAKAAADLIGDIAALGSALARIGIARLESISKTIDANTNASLCLIDAKATADVIKVQESTISLQHRARMQRLSREEKQQINREAVTLVALENIKNDPPKDPVRDAPTEDWFNIFGAYAERASTESFRQHWAFILEHEIRKPGSFSFEALHLASMLDGRLAEKISRVAPFILEGQALPDLEKFQQGPLFSDMMDLACIGFINLSTTGIFLISDHTYGVLQVGNRFARIKYSDNVLAPLKRRLPDGRMQIALSVRHLTTAGREILKLIKHDQHIELLEMILERLPQQLLIGEVATLEQVKDILKQQRGT